MNTSRHGLLRRRRETAVLEESDCLLCNLAGRQHSCMAHRQDDSAGQFRGVCLTDSYRTVTEGFRPSQQAPQTQRFITGDHADLDTFRPALAAPAKIDGNLPQKQGPARQLQHAARDPAASQWRSQEHHTAVGKFRSPGPASAESPGRPDCGRQSAPRLNGIGAQTAPTPVHAPQAALLSDDRQTAWW